MILARAVFAGAPPEVQGSVREFLQRTLAKIAQEADGPSASGGSPVQSGDSSWSLPARWMRPDRGRGRGSRGHAPRRSRAPAPAALTEGRTNAEIAAELDLADEEVVQRLTRLFARIGTSSRAEATSLAFRGLANVGPH